jgi:hypothetical protein
MELQFNLDTFNACCTQVHKTKYSMNVQYHILHTPEIVWAPYHIFQQFEGYCIALSKPRRNVIPSLGYYIIKHQGLNYNTLIGSHYNTFIGPQDNTPIKVSQKYIRLHNISFDM